MDRRRDHFDQCRVRVALSWRCPLAVHVQTQPVTPAASQHRSGRRPRYDTVPPGHRRFCQLTSLFFSEPSLITPSVSHSSEQSISEQSMKWRSARWKQNNNGAIHLLRHMTHGSSSSTLNPCEVGHDLTSSTAGNGLYCFICTEVTGVEHSGPGRNGPPIEPSSPTGP